MYKKALKRLLSLSLVISLIGSGFVYMVDPFFHYHKPYFGLEPSFYDEVYQKPGIIKNLDFDSIITGSSMTQNFKVSQFNDIYETSAIKITNAGARSKDIDRTLSNVLNEREIDYVLLGLDISMLTTSPEITRNPYPEYLYNNNQFDDVKYLLNKDVIFKSSVRTLQQNEFDTNRDLAYSWHKETTKYSSEIVADQGDRPAIEAPKAITKEDIDRLDSNLENILKHIEQHPNTHFIIFYPPYSVLFWDKEIRRGTYDYTIFATRKSMDALVKYDNVELHFFHDMFDVTKNLNNYKDYSHYSPVINESIIEETKNKNYLITSKNIDRRFDDFLKEIENENFDKYFE